MSRTTNVVLLGSTGSIGTQALDVIASHRDRYRVVALAAGRNEDPTWAPDGRHIAFISDRSGRRQIWIIDMETGRVRQLQTPGAARLPSWSRRLGRTAVVPNP